MRRVVVPVVIALVFAPAAAAWTWPVDGPVLEPFTFDRTHPYAGGQHRGIVVGAAARADVRAPAAGVVTFAGTVPESGRSLTIRTSDGLAVTLTHLGALAVGRGADVAEGAVVATAAAAGDGAFTTPYVHLGVREAADEQGYLDPLRFLPAAPVRPPGPAASPQRAAAPAPAAPAPAPAAAAPASAPAAGAAAPPSSAAPSPVTGAAAAPASAAAPAPAPAASAATAPAAAEDAAGAPREAGSLVVAPGSTVAGPGRGPASARPRVGVRARVDRRPATAVRAHVGRRPATAVRVEAPRARPRPAARPPRERERPHASTAAPTDARRARSLPFLDLPGPVARPGARRDAGTAASSPWRVAAVAGAVLLVLACAVVAIGIRMINARWTVVAGAHVDDVAAEDPRGAGLAVREWAEAHRARRGLRGARRRLRALPPAAGQRRPHGQRHRRARHAGDGLRRPERRVAP
jgi:hypothetical protein